jgi:excisionase family DNA binding protein
MQFLTTTEAAARLGVSPTRVRKMLQDGIIRGRRFGRDWLVEKESVLARIAERKKKKEAGSSPEPQQK